MGALCDKVEHGDFPMPNTTNVCSDNIGDKYAIPNFCTLAGEAIGGGYRNEYCDKLGDDEWGDYEAGDSCKYNDCNAVQAFASGCCKGCCGIDGRGVRCIRTAFKGDPTDCCFQDYDGTGQTNSLCFQYNTDMKRTCDPQYRDITKGTCEASVINYCTGEDLPNGDSSWIGRWINPDGTPLSGWTPGDDPKKRGCFYAVNRYVCGSGTCTPADPVSAKGFNRAQTLIQATFARYEADGFIIGAAPGQVGYNNFQDALRSNVCNQYPGLCKGALTQTCSKYTVNDLTNNPELSFWCGCYLAGTEYAKYTDGYQITRQCTPPCNRSGVIPLTDGSGKPVPCTQSVCLIDNITLDLIQTQVAGGISFANACGTCGTQGTGGCVCTIENNSLTAINSQIGGSLIFNQNCTSANCTKLVNGQPVSVPCPDYATNPIATYQANVSNANDNNSRSWVLWILIGIVIVLVIIFLFILVLRPNFQVKQTPYAVYPSASQKSPVLNGEIR
jgi:hypothetical protein